MMTTHGLVFDGDWASEPTQTTPGASADPPIVRLVTTCVQTEFGAWLSGTSSTQRLVQSVLTRLK